MDAAYARQGSKITAVGLIQAQIVDLEHGHGLGSHFSSDIHAQADGDIVGALEQA